MKTNTKNSENMSQREKFQLLNSEVRSFYEYCKEVGMSDDEIDIICRPLMSAVRRATIKRWRRIIILMMLFLATGYIVSQTDSFQWHVAAVARLTLIKLLPLINWTPMYYNQCVLGRLPLQNFEAEPVSTSDCIACEAIQNIARIANTDHNEVLNHHLLRGAPVIVTDAYTDWSSGEYNFTGLVNNDDRLRESVPCRILTNIRIGKQPMDLQEIVSRITESNIPSWFIHFQNCDIRAVKTFRVLAPRPYFLSPEIPPSHFNWLLLSKNYETNRYKYLEFDIGLIIMSQLKGQTSIQLKPRMPCENICGPVKIDLQETETLVLSNSLWEFEYLPGKGENLAMITETDWVET
ncbi:uncharacterized protein LOC123700534 [Colias croceus]|uniref:uncharacterized protein LOC123700534 n=1 Tax=Colias crocea TaxID=72248 RepID=UPI001E27A829|nr:uncharacterized protein LOC123700534 [Colias croceus]CAG4931816.1 unnamed protein product [Colias eurytheme]